MKFIFFLWAALLVLSCGSAGEQRAETAPTFPIKLGTFSGTREHGVTDIFVYSPWEPQQYAQLTFPEHCWGENLPNTSHDSDLPVVSSWKISTDSTQALLVKIPRDKVVFRAKARADSMAVRLRIEIENHSDTSVRKIRSLVCFKPDATIDTPSRSNGMHAFRDTCYRQTYFQSGGRKVQLHEETTFHGEYPPGVAETNVRTKIVWGINVKGCPDIRSIRDVGWWYIGDHPGRVVEELADLALMAIQARDDSNHWIGVIWEPPSVLFCNPLNPCFHSDPSFEDCPPGAETGADGIVLFHEGTFEQLVERALNWKDAIRSAKGGSR